MEDSMEIPLKTSNKTTMFCAVLSHVQLFATPWTIALQAPQSMGFSRQEYWSGCHCLLLGIVNSAATLRYKNLLHLWFSQGICPVVGLLGHMVVLFLVFKGISILFSIVAVPSCIPTNTARRFLFLHVLSSIYCL